MFINNVINHYCLMEILPLIQGCDFDPPLSSSDTDQKIDLVKPTGGKPYLFGANATYSCPPGYTFESTGTRTLTAMCYGPIGWRRDIRLKCIGQGPSALSF